MSKKKILLIVCPPLWEKLPPLGAAYLCKYLQIHGHTPFFYDMNILAHNLAAKKHKKDWTINPKYLKPAFYQYFSKNHASLFTGLMEVIQTNKIDFVGFSLFKSNRIFSIHTANLLKEKFPDIKIIFGGPEVFSLDTVNSFNTPSVDHFIVGEGEKALCEILDRKTNKRVLRFNQLENINYFPKYKNFNLNLYTRKSALPVLFSRGCINKCIFCSEKFLFKGYRTREPENLIEEIKFHISTNKIKWFTFYDSMLNGNLKKLETLMDLIIKNKLNISWDAQVGIRKDMDITLMQKMKEAGCINLFIGLESASDNVLQSMRKNFTQHDAAGFIKKLNTAQLNFELSLIVDFPGENKKDFKETISFMQRNKNSIKKIAQINRFKHYPGIEVAKNKKNDYKNLRFLLRTVSCFICSSLRLSLSCNNSRQDKVEQLLNVLDENNIKYTKQYINNLV
jgi:radical SAM superfamily enzyme YgiQ (UPF0313 family)